MGFDIHGAKPQNKKGEYFRNNVWWWRPLWAYVVENSQDILTEKDREAGGFNDGHLIDQDKAARIAARLFALVKSGATEAEAAKYKAELEALPLVVCDICHGSGKRNDEIIKGECNGCKGVGKRKSFATHYPFEVKNVEEFAEFVENSGGFKIF